MSKGGFNYLEGVAFNKGIPKEASVNTYIRTNDVPAKNRYRWANGQKAKPALRFEKKEYYIEAKETIDSNFNRIVIPESRSISIPVMEREITRGTQQGYKSCVYGPHRPLIKEMGANVNKSIGFLKEQGSQKEPPRPVDSKKWNIAGATYHGGNKDVVDHLGRDLNGRHRTALTGFGTYIHTNSKFVGGSGTGGGRAGMRGKVAEKVA